VRRAHTRRGGFTLVELLVVILLIVILAALSAGAFFKVQAAQRVGATEATIRKLQIGLDARWKDVLHDARKTVPDPIVTLAGGDRDRAIAIWTYAKLKNEFPENFTEATTTIIFATAPPVTLQPRQVFATVAGKPEPDPRLQSAALFYAALTQTGGGGATFDLDGVAQQVGTTPSGHTVFVDSWGTPITFVRWAGPPEVQNEPYARANTIQTRLGPFWTKNPLDPSGKLLMTPDPHPLNAWAQTPNRVIAMNALGIDFTQDNLVPTLISAGPDKEWGLDIYGANSADAGSDNVVGYRLRREGAQGN
jgi:prepilin-type N-terminal cleavage/methylation domain-containing protein